MNLTCGVFGDKSDMFMKSVKKYRGNKLNNNIFVKTNNGDFSFDLMLSDSIENAFNYDSVICACSRKYIVQVVLNLIKLRYLYPNKPCYIYVFHYDWFDQVEIPDCDTLMKVKYVDHINCFCECFQFIIDSIHNKNNTHTLDHSIENIKYKRDAAGYYYCIVGDKIKTSTFFDGDLMTNVNEICIPMGDKKYFGNKYFKIAEVSDISNLSKYKIKGLIYLANNDSASYTTVNRLIDSYPTKPILVCIDNNLDEFERHININDNVTIMNTPKDHKRCIEMIYQKYNPDCHIVNYNILMMKTQICPLLIITSAVGIMYGLIYYWTYF